MTQYHVSLNGQGYVLDLDRYQKRVREPFPSKQTEGSVDFGDLRGPEQLLVISDWSGGEGVVSHEAAPTGYRSGTNVDVSSVPGGVRLGPQVEYLVPDFGVGADESAQMIVFNGHIILGLSNGQLYRYDGTTLTVLANVGLPIRSLGVVMNRLLVGTGGVGAVGEYTTGWVWTAAKFTVPSSTGVYTMTTHYRQAAQYLNVGSSGAGTNGIGRAYVWDGVSLSTGQFDFEELFPLASATYEGRCYFVASNLAPASQMGLYSVDNASGGGQWRFHARLTGALCWNMLEYEGALYIATSGANGLVLTWDGSVLTRVLQLGSLLSPHAGELRGMVVFNGALWVATSEAGTVTLLRYDGKAWSRPVYGLPSTAPRSLAVLNGELYVGTQNAVASFRGSWYRMFGGVRLSGTVESGLINCGLPGVPKLLKSVTIVTSALVSGQTVAVQYRLEDTGSWTTLGTLSAAGATTATYQFPTNTTGRLVGFRAVLTASLAGIGSPVLYELSLRYVPRPTLAREWELAVVLEGTPELPLVTLDSAPEPLTGAQLTSALWTAAGVAGPVTYADLDGASYAVYVQDVREEVGKISQRRGYQRLGLVKLVEAA